MPLENQLEGEDYEEGEEIERGDTGIRILLTLLFVVALRLTETILAIVIVFQLIYALVTRREPGERLRSFADRAVRYAYQIGQYLTYNREEAPFPFDDFPDERPPPIERTGPREVTPVDLDSED